VKRLARSPCLRAAAAQLQRVARRRRRHQRLEQHDRTDPRSAIRDRAQALRDRRALEKKRTFYNTKPKKPRKSRGGKSDAQRAAEKAAREAEALAKKKLAAEAAAKAKGGGYKQIVPGKLPPNRVR